MRVRVGVGGQEAFATGPALGLGGGLGLKGGLGAFDLGAVLGVSLLGFGGGFPMI
jgi:hypothetical protein